MILKNKAFKILLFGYFFLLASNQVVCAEEKGSNLEELKKLSGAPKAVTDTSGSDSELKKRIENLAGHGYAVIDRIRNNTEFPVNIFYNKTLHDLLPPGTVVRIKSFKKDFSQEDVLSDDLKKEAGEKLTQKKEGFAFRYLTAQNLGGNWRLKADSKDPLDPATRFIVRKYLDPNLNSFLGFESEVSSGKMLRVKNNNEVILSNSTSIPEIAKEGQKSKNNFDSAFDEDSHWSIYAKGVKPGDAIDPNGGKYLESLNLKNQYLDSYLSIRGAEDQKSKASYVKPDVYWHWVENAKEWTDSDKIAKKAGPLSAAAETKYRNTMKYPLKRIKIDRQNLVPLSGPNGAITFFKENYGSVRVNDVGGVSGIGERIGTITSSYEAWGRNFKNRSESIDLDNPMINGPNMDNPKSLEECLMIFNHLRNYEYIPDKKQNYGSIFGGNTLLSYWDWYFFCRNSPGCFRNKIAGKKSAIHYGDKIRIVSLGSLLTLNAVNKPYLTIPNSSLVFASHDDTVDEFAKINLLDPSLGKAAINNDASWFYIKGSHKEGDRWNCTIGQPVQDGDTIRLEHYLTGKNLTVVRGKQPPKADLWYGPNLHNSSYKGSSDIVSIPAGVNGVLKYPVKDGKATKPKEHELLMSLSGSQGEGMGSSDDNFVIKFNEPVETGLNIGQAFSLVHQNTKHHLWSQHAFFKANGSVSVGLVSALFPTSEEDVIENGWFVLASESEGLPVQNVGWAGVPDGARQTSAGDSEELEIEIVKLGLSGNLGAGETYLINMPVFAKEPKVAGFSKDVITEFDISKIVTLSPLNSQGIGWLEESLKTSNKATVFFKAKSEDNGDIQIYFGSSIGLDYIWKVVIGGGNNTSSYILKKDYPGGVPVEIKVVEVFKAKNPAAGAIPGQYTAYWISIDDGLIMLGVGPNAGENILIAWRDLSQREPVNRIGFGSGEKPVSFAEVQITAPLQIIPPKKFYFSQSANSSVDSEGIVQINFKQKQQPLVLKVPGSGCLGFNIKGTGNIHFFEDEDNLFKILTDEEYKNKITTELTSNLIQKIDLLKQSVGLSELFNQDSSINEKIQKEKIIDFLISHQDHILKKYVESLPDSEQLKPENSFVLDVFSNNLEDINKEQLQGFRNKIGALVQKYIFTNIKDPLIKSLDIAKICAQVVLGKKSFSSVVTAGENNLNIIDAKTWVTADLINQNNTSKNKINNHYRLRIQDFQSINTKINEIKIQLINAIKNYCNQLILEDISSNENLLKSIIKNNLVLVDELKKIGILNPQTKNIEDRVKTNKDDFQKLKIKFDDVLFKKIFPDQFILYLIQNCSDLTEACIVFEKYSQSNKTYEFLVSSKDQDSERLDTSIGDGKQFWLAFDKGRFFLGLGSLIGEDLILYYWDIFNPLTDIQKIGFSSLSNGSLSNFKIGNSPKFINNESSDGYSQQDKTFDYKGSLQIISPYEYQLSQEDQQVKFVDILSKKTLFPGKTPQQGALYFFTLMLEKNGFPNLVWTKEPENPLKIELDKRAAIHQAASDTLFQASTYVQGMGAIGGMIGVLASIGFAGAGLSEGTKAGELKSTSTNSFRSNDSYVYTDTINDIKKMADDSIPPKAMENKKKIDDELSKGRDYTVVDSADKLPRIISLYGKVLDLITHPYAISSSKEWFHSGLDSLYKAFMQYFGKQRGEDVDTQVHNALLGILIKAYNNPYLVDVTKSDEVQNKKNWFAQINQITKTIISSSKEKEITLPPCFGEYIWLDSKFLTPNKGSIIFKVKANNDLFVCFAETPVSVRNTDQDIYEIVLGAFGKNENEKTVIRAKSLDKAVAETLNPDGLVNPVEYKKFWLSFNNGRIIIGSGDLDPNNAIGVYDPVKMEVRKVSWEPYSYKIELGKEWIKEVIGDAKGYYGKDFLIYELEKSTDENDKKNLLTLIADRKKKISALFNKKIYPYKTSSDAQGFYREEPFLWQDPYFDTGKTKITNVGFSNWNSETSLKNITVSVAVEEIDFYLKNLYAQGKNNTSTEDETSNDFKLIFDEEPLAKNYKDLIYPVLQKKRASELKKVVSTKPVPKNEDSKLEPESEPLPKNIDLKEGPELGKEIEYKDKIVKKPVIKTPLKKLDKEVVSFNKEDQPMPVKKEVIKAPVQSANVKPADTVKPVVDEAVELDMAPAKSANVKPVYPLKPAVDEAVEQEQKDE